MSRAATFAAVAASLALSGGLMVGPTAAAPPDSAGLRAAGTTAGSAGTIDPELLVRYLPRRRLPVQLRIAYQGVCSLDCRVFARTTLVLPGPNVTTGPVSGSFDANQVFEAFIKLNRPALAALKRHRREARLRTRIRAVDLVSGVEDIDRRTFRFRTG